MINKFFCWIGWCLSCAPKSDDTACWGECVHCEKRHGVTSRKTIRKYIEREEALKESF